MPTISMHWLKSAKALQASWQNHLHHALNEAEAKENEVDAKNEIRVASEEVFGCQ